MNNPIDRLGQPLSVGDWVVKVSCGTESAPVGWRDRICAIDDDPLGCLQFGTPDADGDVGSWGKPMYYEKINPKQQTTTWDDCVFKPEGMKV